MKKTTLTTIIITAILLQFLWFQASAQEPFHGYYHDWTFPNQHGDQYLKRITKVGARVVSIEEVIWDEFGNLVQWHRLDTFQGEKLTHQPNFGLKMTYHSSIWYSLQGFTIKFLP